VAAARGENRGVLLGLRVPLDQGIAGWVARHHEALTLDGEVEDPRFSPLLKRDDIAAALSVPLLTGGRFVGCWWPGC
jgi:signal transduction protein with GAF and PtsI domain